MTYSATKIAKLSLMGCATFILAIDASATEGYFTHGSGARHKAMGGAGVADGRDATILALNPAGIVDVENELDVAVSLFVPKRKFTGSGGPGFTTTGIENVSHENLFAIPNIAYVHGLSDDSAVAIGINANGGMNTNYRDVPNPACVSPPFPASNGVYCGGTAGVNLNQAFVSVGYAKKFDRFSVGISPVLAVQAFEAQGILAFGGASTNPAALSNNGTEMSTGIGARIGVEVDISNSIRVGGSYQTKINMSKFDDYAGLFEGGGDFDIPANFQVGISADVMPNLTLNADYRHIKYDDVPAVSNSSIIQQPFGSDNGPGFGWNNLDVYKVGAEYRYNNKLTLRAGYAHNNQPVNGRDVTINLLAPGVVKDHYTGGGSYRLNDKHTIELALMHAPSEAVAGIEITPQGPNPTHFISTEMKQYEATIGWKMKFGN